MARPASARAAVRRCRRRPIAARSGAASSTAAGRCRRFAAWAACWVVFAVAARARRAAGRRPSSSPALLGAALALLGATPLAARLHRLRLSALVRGVGPRRRRAGLGLAAAAGAARLASIRGAPGATRRSSRRRRGALRGLAAPSPLADGARVLDAGCGLGDGLRELRREYPRAALAGIEWSWPLRARLRAALPLRARAARRHVGGGLVGLRPGLSSSSGPRAWQRAADKAGRELKPGAWLASLEFEIVTQQPTRVLRAADGRSLWLYRLPFAGSPASGG